MTDDNSRGHEDDLDHEAPYRITYGGETMVTVPWDVYVSSVWFMHSKDIQFAAVAWRPKNGTDADLLISTGIVSTEDKVVLKRFWRRTQATETETVAGASTAIARFAEKYKGELTHLDIRGDTRTMEQIIAAVALIEIGWVEAEA